jgi:hypothetical protein
MTDRIFAYFPRTQTNLASNKDQYISCLRLISTIPYKETIIVQNNMLYDKKSPCLNLLINLQQYDTLFAPSS